MKRIVQMLALGFLITGGESVEAQIYGQRYLGSVDINLGKIGGIGILRLSETKEGPQDEPVRNPRFAMECHQRPYAWAHRYERGYRQG